METAIKSIKVLFIIGLFSSISCANNVPLTTFNDLTQRSQCGALNNTLMDITMNKMEISNPLGYGNLTLINSQGYSSIILNSDTGATLNGLNVTGKSSFFQTVTISTSVYISDNGSNPHLPNLNIYKPTYGHIFDTKVPLNAYGDWNCFVGTSTLLNIEFGVNANDTGLGVNTFITNPIGALYLNSNTNVNGNLKVTGSINTAGKHWELIYSNTIASAVNVINVTSLNGNTDTIYEIEYMFYNPTGSEVEYSVKLNNDSVGSNYHNIKIIGSGSSVTSSSGLTWVCADSFSPGYYSFGEIMLYAKSGSPRLAKIEYTSGVAASGIADERYIRGIWNDTTDNITSINFFQDYGGGNGFGIGSYIYIFALR
jgi:hypothetical protein